MHFKLEYVILLVFCFKFDGFANAEEPPSYTLPAWGDQEQLAQIISQRDKSFPTLIQNVAYRGSSQHHLTLTLRELNLAMRESYRGFINGVGKSLFPVIVSSDYETDFAGVGSTYTLYLADGTMKHMAPVPPSYEQNKALCHMTLALFTIVSPYFHHPTSSGWRVGLAQYKDRLSASLAAFEEVDETFSEADKERGISMIKMALEYADGCLHKKSANYEDFVAYADQVMPLVEEAMAAGAKAQVEHVYPALEAWKKELGPAEWSKLYVIIPTVWPTAGVNPREQIFGRLMDPAKVKTNMIKVENSSGDEFGRQTLGRVVGDRSMAHMVFGVKTPSRIDHLLSLSTRRDLVSTGCENSIVEYLASTAGGARVKARDNKNK